MELKFSASKHSTREDSEGEVTLTLKVPQQDAATVLALPVQTLLHITVETEKE